GFTRLNRRARGPSPRGRAARGSPRRPRPTTVRQHGLVTTRRATATRSCEQSAGADSKQEPVFQRLARIDCFHAHPPLPSVARLRSTAPPVCLLPRLNRPQRARLTHFFRPRGPLGSRNERVKQHGPQVAPDVSRNPRIVLRS